MRLLRCGLLLGTVACLTAGLLNADQPETKDAPATRPPWQRLLGRKDQSQADQLAKEVAAATQEQKWDTAIQAAEKLVALRDKAQGADHWQAVDARLQLRTLRRVAGLKPEEQQRFAGVRRQQTEAHALVRKGRYAQAQRLLEEILEIRRRLLGEEHPDTASAYNNLAANQNAQGKYADAETGYRKALESFRKLLGEEHPNTATAYNNLAMNQNAQGKYAEAENGLRKALELRRKLLGEEHPDTAAAYNNLAANQDDQGKYADAETGYRKALELKRKLLGEEHPATALAYNNLAFNQNAQGKFAEAESGFRKALALRRKLLGEEHPATATAYNNLAMNQNAQGKYADAENGFRKALESFRKLLGEEHPNTATAYNNLAMNQNAQGKYAEAENGFRKALELKRKLLGEEHPDTALACNNLALNQNAQGKYAQAENGFRKALALFRKLLGEDHPNTATAYNNLAGNQDDQGKYAEAEIGYRKALALRRKLLGEEHPDTAGAYSGLARNQNAQGKYGEAEIGYRKALELKRKLLGEEHPATATAYRGLARNQNTQGKYAEAEIGYRKALALSRKLLGEEHPDTANAYSDLAYNQKAQGKYGEAETGFRKALELNRKLLGEEHPDTANAYSNLAANQNAQDKYGEAEIGFRKALELKRKLLGKEHPATANAYNSLACNQYCQGKYAEAENGFRKALALRRKLLGEEHPDTAQAYYNLAFNQYAQGKYAQAEEEFVKAAKVSRTIRPGLAASGLERTVAAGAQASPLFPLAALLARDQKPEAAWQGYEEALGRGTLDDLSSRLRYSTADQDRLTQLLARRDRLEQLLLPLLPLDKPSPQQEQRRKELLADKLQTLEQLRAHQSHLEKTYGPVAGQVFDWKTVQAALPRDTALVGWIDLDGEPNAADPNGERWALLLRASGPPVCERLKGTGKQQSWTEEDSTLPGRLRTALANSQGNWRELARDLRQQRLAPLEKHLAATADLPAVRRLIVLPSYSLDGLPLEVLAEGRTVSYSLSGTLFAHLRQLKPPTGQGLLALGDPVFQLLPAPKPPLPERGLLITFVAPQSNAAKAELRPGDVLLRYGSTDLRSRDDLKIQAPGDDPKARVPLTIWRLEQQDGRPVARTVELTVRPGPLGITTNSKPAPVALADRRRIEAETAQRGGDWQELPGTRCEVERLARLFRSSQAEARVLLDGRASKRALYDLARSGTLGQYRYLHLATHGEVEPRFELRSRLILSRDPSTGEELPGFDGELTAEEILRQWHLKADLVTLSACETALGTHTPGEGHIGFANTLLLTGARSVVLSLWKVDDAATSLLMERFYQNLLGQRDGLKKPLPKAEALAEAKDWLRKLSRKEVLERVAALTEGVSRGKDRPALPRLAEPPKPTEGAPDAPFAHPYYWAAFVLFGDPE